MPRIGNNEFTIILHARGWTVTEACEYWGIKMQTFYERVYNENKHAELRSMCKGMDRKD